MSTMTLHLSESTSAKLDALAHRLDVRPEALAEKALQFYLDEEALIIASIEAGIADAAAGRFVSDAVVEGFFARFNDGTLAK